MTKKTTTSNTGKCRHNAGGFKKDHQRIFALLKRESFSPILTKGKDAGKTRFEQRRCEIRIPLK